MEDKALLLLENGSIFYGKSFGYKGVAVGEVVFNTAMTGYQEILTDPSYTNQLVSLTCPHIGNVGVNKMDEESKHIWLKGLIIRNLSPVASNWRSEGTLNDYLISHKTIGISHIDTRRLTKILRVSGVQIGCIMSGEHSVADAQSFLTSFPFANVNSINYSKPYQYNASRFNLHTQPHVVVCDYGVKDSILRTLADLNCKITVVPYSATLADIITLQPDGVVLSNGPGNPADFPSQIELTKQLLDYNIPILGICLGCQLLGLASGAKTEKMKFGHHGVNHPVLDLSTNKVFITSQNHGYVISDNLLPGNIMVTHRSLFDKSIQAIKRIDKPAFGFQSHPEGSPGPADLNSVFINFINLLETYKNMNVLQVSSN